MVSLCLKAQYLMFWFSMSKLRTIQNLKLLGLSKCLGIYCWVSISLKNTTWLLIGSLAPSIFLAATLVAWVLSTLLLFLISWIPKPSILSCFQLIISFGSMTFPTWVSSICPLHPVLSVPLCWILWVLLIHICPWVTLHIHCRWD